jgi:hypothetical protein
VTKEQVELIERAPILVFGNFPAQCSKDLIILFPSKRELVETVDRLTY